MNTLMYGVLRESNGKVEKLISFQRSLKEIDWHAVAAQVDFPSEEWQESSML